MIFSKKNINFWQSYGRQIVNNKWMFLKVDIIYDLFEVGLSPSKKICVICFIETHLKLMKNAFCFILKTLFVLKIFKFLSWRENGSIRRKSTDGVVLKIYLDHKF